MPPELLAFLEFLPKIAEYGAVGIVMGILYVVARLYVPHFAALSAGVQALPAALDALTGEIKGQGKELQADLGEVREELAVIRDRLPRAQPAPAPIDREQLLAELRAIRAARAAGTGD